MYYTFRQITTSTYEVTKWEDDRAIPLDTFNVTRKRNAFYCDCPAHVPNCRHIKMLREMVECDCIQESFLWYYDDNGWQSAHDFIKFWPALESKYAI